MLKCCVKEDPPAVFPKERSVLLLAAVVLLVCCCLVVPAAAADDVIVEPTVSIDSNVGTEAYNVSKIVDDAYYIEVATSPVGLSPSTYNIGVNVTYPPEGDWDITFEWSDHIPGKVTFDPSDTLTVQGNSMISTIVITGSAYTKYNSWRLDERPSRLGMYYQVTITAENNEDSFSPIIKKIYVDVLYPIKPMDLTIYANDTTFPNPRYEYSNDIIRSTFTIEGTSQSISGKEYDKYPFTIHYYDIVTNTNAEISTPVDSGIYKAVIESTDDTVDLSDIRITTTKSKTYPILFPEGTLTVLPTTENVMLSPSTSPDTGSNGNIFAYFGSPGDSPGYNLNGDRTGKFEDKYGGLYGNKFLFNGKG